MLQTVQVFLADTVTATACRSVLSLISLNRTDLLMDKVTPPVALSPGELFVIPEKPVKLIFFIFSYLAFLHSYYLGIVLIT